MERTSPLKKVLTKKNYYKKLKEISRKNINTHIETEFISLPELTTSIAEHSLVKTATDI